MVSKYIAQLEGTLGVSLLNRTTRKIHLTELGNQYYTRCKLLIEEVEELDQSIAEQADEPSGVLKIIAPVDFGGMYMVDVVKQFQHAYPQVIIQLHLDNRPTDLADGLYDIAIRVTDRLEPGLVARPIVATQLSTYAAPDYLAQHGCPQSIDELAEHRCLKLINTPHSDAWLFRNETQILEYKPSWSFESNNGSLLCQASSIGMGIIQVPKMTAEPFLTAGLLQEILTNWTYKDLNIYAIYQQSRYVPKKIALFIRLLKRISSTEIDASD